MAEDQVVGYRSRKFLVFESILLLFGVIGCFLLIFIWHEDILLSIFGIVVGSVTLVLWLYCALLPTEAVVIRGNDIIIRYVCRKFVCDFSRFMYASYKEKGEFYNRRFDSLRDIHVFCNDIRIVHITFRDIDGALFHKCLMLRDAVATVETLNAMAEERKEKTENRT